MAANPSFLYDGEDDGDYLTLISEQRRELMDAEALDSDLDLAFQLQLQEALTASLASQPSTTSSSSSSFSILQREREFHPHRSGDDDVTVLNFLNLQSRELSKLEQELKDREQSEIEMRRMREDLSRRLHDEKVAREMTRIPEDDWIECGDIFEIPFGEGSSKDVENNAEFRLYFKGFSSVESVKNQKVVLAGIGIAICDSRDNLIFKMRKPLIGHGVSRNGAEAKALIEGLNVALALELKRIVFYCDYYPLYQFVMGRWPAKQRKIAMLINQVTLLRRKFTHCMPQLVPRYDIKFAFKLAREAIMSQTTGLSDSNHGDRKLESCVICLEDCEIDKVFSVDGCLHRYCFSCMKQHIEVKLLQGIVPKCPHENCKTDLSIESCKKFLTPKLIETMRQRLKEASIPITEKVYCPYPRCSALMSKSDVFHYSRDIFVNGEQSLRKCMKCHGLFCHDCKVPWHSGLKCPEYERLNPNPPVEDLKLKSLATWNLWRQCKKCNHMIELSEGCNHMTCRCGHEFCYSCGAEWVNKMATCSCPGWDEDNIWYHGNDRDFEEEEEEEEEEDDDDFYDSDWDDDFY